ncbi:MAG: hypothetical protein U0802_15085 [Candidatus Binatia bacterium]
MRSMQRVCASACAVGLLIAGATSAIAATITVAPGPGTPVQDAINAASPGDTVLLMADVRSASRSTSLKLRGSSTAGQATSTVEAPCAAGAAIDVAADRR